VWKKIAILRKNWALRRPEKPKVQASTQDNIHGTSALGLVRFGSCWTFWIFLGTQEAWVALGYRFLFCSVTSCVTYSTLYSIPVLRILHGGWLSSWEVVLFSYCKPGQDLFCLILRRTQISLVYGELATSVHHRQPAKVLGYLVCSKLLFFPGHFPATAVLQSLILLHSSTTFSPCLLTFQECSFHFLRKAGSSDPSLWDFSCGSWSLKDAWDFNPFYFHAVYAVSFSNLIRCLPADPCASADCKILVCFCESLLRVGGIHSRSFDNLGLFFNRLRGPRP